MDILEYMLLKRLFGGDSNNGGEWKVCILIFNLKLH